jgi:wyosine [tRNA(Phe)-imidazoG37] synthetase (radical SAM superfamily)
MPSDVTTLPTDKPVSSIYGPVRSWRVGQSLGVDLLLQTSICSFNCIYCQLGDIQLKTIERQIYVPTAKVEQDLRLSAWESADIITFSGSGEPTLALNIGEVIHLIREYTHKHVMILTNGTTLHDPHVQKDLLEADAVAVKLDASSDEMLRRINRPVNGVSLEKIVQGARQFRNIYKGKLSLQCMFMPANLKDADDLAEIIKQIQPDEVQLNTPKRPYPLEWAVDSRGNHDQVDVPSVSLKTVSPEEAESLENLLREKTGIPIVSIYTKKPVDA